MVKGNTHTHTHTHARKSEYESVLGGLILLHFFTCSKCFVWNSRTFVDFGC